MNTDFQNTFANFISFPNEFVQSMKKKDTIIQQLLSLLHLTSMEALIDTVQALLQEKTVLEQQLKDKTVLEQQLKDKTVLEQQLKEKPISSISQIEEDIQKFDVYFRT